MFWTKEAKEGKTRFHADGTKQKRPHNSALLVLEVRQMTMELGSIGPSHSEWPGGGGTHRMS
jgi:hypothetical protein